jgi:hypothetical protein
MKPVREVTMADLDSILYTKDEAIRLGVGKYLSNKDCPKKHRPVRYISNDNCVYCARESATKSYFDNWEEKKRKDREYGKLRRLLNPEAARKKGNDWAARNRARMSAASSEWAKKNPEKVRLRRSEYRAKQRNAIPAWANREKILEFYREAQRRTAEFGIKYSVDHIVPLKSDVVCGLHCETNLQIITHSENCAKKNRYWPDMP